MTEPDVVRSKHVLILWLAFSCSKKLNFEASNWCGHGWQVTQFVPFLPCETEYWWYKQPGLVSALVKSNENITEDPRKRARYVPLLYAYRQEYEKSRLQWSRDLKYAVLGRTYSRKMYSNPVKDKKTSSYLSTLSSVEYTLIFLSHWNLLICVDYIFIRGC